MPHLIDLPPIRTPYPTPPLKQMRGAFPTSCMEGKGPGTVGKEGHRACFPLHLRHLEQPGRQHIYLSLIAHWQTLKKHSKVDKSRHVLCGAQLLALSLGTGHISAKTPEAIHGMIKGWLRYKTATVTF